MIPDIQNVNTPALALLAGAVVSIHCVGMCGPIACSLTSLKKDEAGRFGAAVFYHGGRLLSYTAVGAMLGAIGAKPLEFFHHSSMSFLPWILVIAFVGIAGALAMGLATPLLPCAPLYLLFAASLATGSAIRGAEFAFAFALGTIPLLWATQLGMQKLQLKIGAKYVSWLQRGLAIVAALFIAKRLLYDPVNDLHRTNTPTQSEQSAPPTLPEGKYG